MGICFRFYEEGQGIKIVGESLEIEVMVREIRGSETSRDVDFDVVAWPRKYSVTLDKKSPPFELAYGVTLGVGRRRHGHDKVQVVYNVSEEYWLKDIRKES